ncbi:DUF2399 domain-containing protein [Luteimonas sp. XNQY3]|nr:DUF2399 domain-containing protein [Luteimonas sp. XNQY3]MCD9006019.1 DUF2399 domain-containing protein [Luteimonas sp. XNQY3]
MSDAGWTEPDENGIRTLPLRGRSVLERRRRRRADRVDTEALRSWPGNWKSLARDWTRGASASRRWDKVLEQAGIERTQAAEQLCDELLQTGWIELDEQRDPQGHWRTVQMRWVNRTALRIALGLDDPAALDAASGRLLGDGFADPRLPALADTLTRRPAKLRLRRLQLLRDVDRWISAAHVGSRRQFALFARGDTKAVTEDEWRWLDDSISLQALGIETHRPGFWLRAPLDLQLPGGALSLGASPEMLALTPATLQSVRQVAGRVGCWRVVENRTSFEQAALAHGDVDGVVWVPGFPGNWWRDCMTTLLRLAPADVRISCDPDPAGIRIALCVASVCEGQGARWSPWRMDGDDLRGLARTRALGDYDRAELVRLRDVRGSTVFEGLMHALEETGRKGEQEGFGRAP